MASALRTGSVFAQDYRVIGPLDEGGMGMVYRVEQLSTGQERALKVLKPKLLADAKSVDRFTQEAMVGAQIASDHVVKVIAAGVDDETGIPWIAMELLKGETLEERVRRRAGLPASEALDVCRQLGHALAAAHGAGVVHRDLKPENVFVADAERADVRFTVKLLDFGLAKVLQEFETSAAATAAVGSPLWMAPEQVRLGKVKPATDVWALGLMVFWMLTAKHYWKAAADPRGANAEAILHEKLFGALDAPSKRAAALGCAAALPAGFDAWFKKCVARDPDDRFPDAGEALAALAPVLTRELAGTRPAMSAPLAAALALAIVLTAAFVHARFGAPAAALTALPPVASDAPTVATPRAQRPREGPARVESDDDAPTPTPPRRAALPVAPARGARQRPPAAIAQPRGELASAGGGDAFARRGAPVASGYVLASRPEWDRRCSGRRYAYQATPQWYSDARATLAQRAQRVRAEEEMAARTADPTSRTHLAAAAEASRAQLARDEELARRQMAANLRGEAARSARAARSAGCADAGLREEPGSVYAVWCCP